MALYSGSRGSPVQIRPSRPHNTAGQTLEPSACHSPISLRPVLACNVRARSAIGSRLGEPVEGVGDHRVPAAHDVLILLSDRPGEAVNPMRFGGPAEEARFGGQIGRP